MDSAHSTRGRWGGGGGGGWWLRLLWSLVLLLLTPACARANSEFNSLVEQADSGLVQVSHSSDFPPNFVRIAKGGKYPLLDQPNLSHDRVVKGHDDVIHGSKKAFTVTKLEYLKKEWCKSEPVRQTIRKEGCLKRTILNRFCYGQCNSFYIPRRRRKDMDSAAFKSCAFCRPRRTNNVWVTLHCPGKKRKFLRQKIQVIKKCKCMALRLD